MIHATLMLRRRDRDQQVLDYLHRVNAPVTAADVGDACGISKKHAHFVLTGLLDRGLVHTAPGRRGLGRRGRLPTRFEADRQSRYAAERGRG